MVLAGALRSVNSSKVWIDARLMAGRYTAPLLVFPSVLLLDKDQKSFPGWGLLAATTEDVLVIKDLIGELIAREGGYVNHPADKGGPTKYGITQRTLGHYRRAKATIKDVQELTAEEAALIYEQNYWKQPGFDQLALPTLLEAMVLDAGVLHGPSDSVKFLQTAAKVLPDGQLGPVSRKAINAIPPDRLAADFMAARIIHVGKVITDTPSQAVFAEGWCRRMAHFIQTLDEI